MITESEVKSCNISNLTNRGAELLKDKRYKNHYIYVLTDGVTFDYNLKSCSGCLSQKEVVTLSGTKEVNSLLISNTWVEHTSTV